MILPFRRQPAFRQEGDVWRCVAHGKRFCIPCQKKALAAMPVMPLLSESMDTTQATWRSDGKAWHCVRHGKRFCGGCLRIIKPPKTTGTAGDVWPPGSVAPPEVSVVRYSSPRDYEKKAPKMLAEGWRPEGQSQARARGLRLPGKGLVITWMRER